MKKRILKTVHGNVEILGEGQQFVALGAHSSGVRYQWDGGLPNDVPTLSPEQFERLWSALTSKFSLPSSASKSPSKSDSSTQTGTSDGSQSILTEIDEVSWVELRKALKFMLDKVQDNDTWSSIGYALLSIKNSRPAQSLWIEFSKKATGYTPGAPEAWWDAHVNQAPRSDFRHIFTIARSAGWGRTADPEVFAPIAPAALRSDGGEPAGGSEVSEDPERPVVQIVDAALPANINQMEGLLKDKLFTQGDLLTRLARANLNDDIRRNSDQVVLLTCQAGYVRKLLTESATFMKFDGRAQEWRAVSCPNELVNVLLDQGDWPQLRPLDAIARAPFVREDGSICDTPGYDSSSRALYLPGTEFPAVPDTPTIDDARAAFNRLMLPFDQFPWYTASSRSAFAAHILTESARLAIDRAPMFWYTAPDAGTGKTMLSEFPSTIVHGTAPAVRPWCANGEELRKTLFASLLAGDRSIAFDNLPTGYKARAPELCAFLTSSIWKDRKLGVSETHSVRNRAVVSASGNNITPVSDMARRSLVVRLDANSDSMRERRFKIPDLRGHVLSNRPALLIDALTIIKAYTLASGIDTIAMPSFERWTKLCCEPLIWLGEPNPRETQYTETDDETESLAPIFDKLSAAFGERKFGPMDIAKLVGSVMDADGELGALMLNQGCAEPNNALKVGYWLRSIRDKRAGPWKITHAGKDMHGAKWMFKRDNTNEDLS
jgi:hypothetical protein